MSFLLASALLTRTLGAACRLSVPCSVCACIRGILMLTASSASGKRVGHSLSRLSSLSCGGGYRCGAAAVLLIIDPLSLNRCSAFPLALL